MTNWTHDALAADLAAHLKTPNRMVWLDMQLGPAGSPRPDVYALEKSYAHPNPMAYECKISRSDFRADVTAAKWSSYLEYAYAVIFAAPVGIISKDEIPPQCGLMVRHENAWRLAKRATPIPRTIAQDALLKLVIDGVRREGPDQRAKHWRSTADQREFNRRFGAAAARYVSDAASIHAELEAAEMRRCKLLEQAEREAEAIRKRAEENAPARWAELLHILGLPSDAREWRVKQAISEIRKSAQGGDEARALRQTISTLRGIVQNHEHLCVEAL